MKTQVHVRAAQPEDATEISRAHVLAWQSAYRGIIGDDTLASLDIEQRAQSWRRDLSSPSADVEVLVVCVDDRVVGFSVYGTPREPAEPETGELRAINLRPDYWSQGLGFELFQESLSGLRRLGYGRAYLWVAHGNDRAIRFYGKHGWTDDGVVKVDERFTPTLTEDRYSVNL